jgi:hypothetical protein
VGPADAKYDTRAFQNENEDPERCVYMKPGARRQRHKRDILRPHSVKGAHSGFREIYKPSQNSENVQTIDIYIKDKMGEKKHLRYDLNSDQINQ